MRVKICKLVLRILMVLFFCSNVATASDKLAKLEQLIAQSRYEAAWQEAKKWVGDYEGNPRFDYLYGLSALETGNYDQAVFALDRVTINQPNIIRPRLELARAYLKVKNDKAALREFKEVLLLKPPAAVERNVNQYIQALAKRNKKNRKWILDGLLSLAGGIDTNANFGAEDSVFNVPLLGVVNLRDDSLKQNSPFTDMSGRLNYRYVMSDTQSVFLNTRLGYRHFTDASSFDLSDLNIKGGSLFSIGQLQYKLSLNNQALRLDNSAYSNTLGVELGVGRELAQNRVIAGSFRAEDYDHKQQPLRDARRYALSGRYRFDQGSVRHQFELQLGQGRADNKAGKYHTRNSIGLGYLAKYTWDATQVTFFSTEIQNRQYRANDPVYAKKRQDNQLLLKIGHSKRLGKHLSAFADLGYINNSSNLDIYETNKTFARTGINYHF